MKASSQERRREAQLAAQFHRDHIIESDELAQWACLYFGVRGDKEALVFYRRWWGRHPR